MQENIGIINFYNNYFSNKELSDEKIIKSYHIYKSFIVGDYKENYEDVTTKTYKGIIDCYDNGEDLSDFYDLLEIEPYLVGNNIVINEDVDKYKLILNQLTKNTYSFNMFCRNKIVFDKIFSFEEIRELPQTMKIIKNYITEECEKIKQEQEQEEEVAYD